MRLRISAACSDECGVRVRGELDTETREFIHRVQVPEGSEDLVREPPTEVVPDRLVTFAPATSDWAIDCPLCRRRIAITP